MKTKEIIKNIEKIQHKIYVFNMHGTIENYPYSELNKELEQFKQTVQNIDRKKKDQYHKRMMIELHNGN